MKNKFIYIVMLILGTLTSCVDDEFEPMTDLAECTWHISTERENTLPIKLQLNEYISIMDLSQGELSHEWYVSEDGTKFLNGKMEWGQTDYSNLVDESIPHVNSEKLIHVYFTKGGDHTIRLRNTYSKQVAYPYSVWDVNVGSYVTRYTYSKDENGVQVFDTTFHVRVYDPNMMPDVKVYSDPECTQEIKTGIIGGTEEAPEYETYELEYGKSVYLKDASYGFPNQWTFACPAAKISDVITNFEQPYALTFKKFQEDPFNVRMTIERKQSDDDKYTPTAPAKTMMIPLNIKVIPSKDPVAYTIRQLDQTRLAIDLNNAEFGYGNINVSGLTLKYHNKNAITKDGNITISKAEVNKDYRYELILTLGEKIYNTDELTLTGTLNKALYGGADLQLVASESNVTTTYGSYLDEDFEGEVASGDWKVINADVVPAVEIVNSSIVNDPFDSNNHCLSVDGLEGHCRALISKAFNGGKGKYTFRYKYYIKKFTSGQGLNAFFVPVGKEGTQDETWATKGWCGFDIGADTGWKQKEITITSKSEMDNILLSLRFNAYRDVIYFDDIFFGYIEVRP